MAKATPKRVSTPEEKLEARAARLEFFNLTIADQQKIYDYQDGRCAICRKPLVLGTAGVVTDHCHTTGLVRGLLCFRCNKALGYFSDLINLVQCGVAYLLDPPATAALGEARYGLPGRVGTKAQRLLLKKIKKAAAGTQP